jgi:hypothetical protein
VRMNHARVEIQRIKNMEIKEVMNIGSRLRVLSDTSKGVGVYHHAAHKYGFKVGMEYENEQGGNRASGGINKHEAEESVWERIEGRAGDDGDLYESGRGKGSTVSPAGSGGGNRGLLGSDGDSSEKIQGSPWGKGGEGSTGSFDMFPFDEVCDMPCLARLQAENRLVSPGFIPLRCAKYPLTRSVDNRRRNPLLMKMKDFTPSAPWQLGLRRASPRHCKRGVQARGALQRRTRRLRVLWRTESLRRRT